MNSTVTSFDDEQHLKLLSIFHYVVGGLTALFACIPLIHLFLGVAMIFAPEMMGAKAGEQPPQAIGWLFACIGGLMFLVGQALAICTLLAGRFIAQRRRYWFVSVMACVECAIFPFGTVLGVFTILTLSRHSVKAWDDEAQEIVDAVRGRMKQGTLFQVSDEIVLRIRIGVRKWIACGA